MVQKEEESWVAHHFPQPHFAKNKFGLSGWSFLFPPNQKHDVLDLSVLTWSFEPYVEFVPYSTLREFWAHKAQRLGGVSDHYLTAPLIAGFRSLDTRPPAPAPSTLS